MDASKGLIVLKPVLHNNIWGGRRLEQFGYELPDGPVGECWGISAHPHGDCTVDGGPFDGMTLSQLWDEHHELFEGATGDRFPLLIKVLDALDDLSIQVHPDDAYAMEHENGSLGKHECWYVLDCHEHAHIIVGQHAKSREEFAKMVEENRWQDMENFVPIKKGDFFDIKPGTVHARISYLSIFGPLTAVGRWRSFLAVPRRSNTSCGSFFRPFDIVKAAIRARARA